MNFTNATSDRTQTQSGVIFAQDPSVRFPTPTVSRRTGARIPAPRGIARGRVAPPRRRHLWSRRSASRRRATRRCSLTRIRRPASIILLYRTPRGNRKRRPTIITITCTITIIINSVTDASTSSRAPRSGSRLSAGWSVPFSNTFIRARTARRLSDRKDETPRTRRSDVARRA